MLFDILYDACPNDCAAARAELLAQAEAIFRYQNTREPLGDRHVQSPAFHILPDTRRQEALPAKQVFAFDVNAAQTLSPVNHPSLHKAGQPCYTFGPTVSISSDSDETTTNAAPSIRKKRSTSDVTAPYPSLPSATDQEHQRKRRRDLSEDVSTRTKSSRRADRPARERSERPSSSQQCDLPLSWDWRYLLVMLDTARSCQPADNRHWPPIPTWLAPGEELLSVKQFPSRLPDTKSTHRQSFKADADDSSYALDALHFLYEDAKLDRSNLACFYTRANKDELAQFKLFTQIARLKRDVLGSTGVCHKLVQTIEDKTPPQIAWLSGLSRSKIELVRELSRPAREHPRCFELASSFISHRPIPTAWDARVYFEIIDFVKRFDVTIDYGLSPNIRQLFARPRLEFDIDRSKIPPLATFPREKVKKDGKPAALSALAYIYDAHDLDAYDLEGFRQHAPPYLLELLQDLANVAKLRFVVTRLNGGLLPQLRDALLAQPHLCSRQDLDLVTLLATKYHHCFDYFSARVKSQGRVETVKQR